MRSRRWPALWAFALAAALTACGAPQSSAPTPQPTPPPPQPAVTAKPKPPPPAELEGPRLAVAADSSDAANAAMQLLEAGGSAADAAIAAMFVGGVVQPVSSGLGGGGFALYFDAASQTTHVIDFREVAPIGLRASVFERRPLAQRKRGALVGVPGELAGLAMLQKRWGTRPLKELLAPAIALARDGFEVSRHLHRALRWRQAWIMRSAGARRVFAPGGRLLDKGQRATNETLAKTLEAIADGGPEVFYRGVIAEDILRTATRVGSRMVASDLDDYRAKLSKPLRVALPGHGGAVLLTTPPPSAGGLLIAQTLTMHDRASLGERAYQSGGYYHLLAETFRGATADRMRFIGDPPFIKMDVAALIAPKRMQKRRAAIADDRTRAAERFQLPESGTSQIVVVDAAGNVAVVASSINSMFGARLMTDGGIVLNDQLANFDSQRRQLRFRARLKPNAPRGGARPVSSLAPTLLLVDGAPALAVSGSGGSDAPTAIAQCLLARLVFERSPEQSVADGRIRTPLSGGLRLDPRADEALVRDLRARGEIVQPDLPDFSAVQLVTIGKSERQRQLHAVSDARKGGAGIVR